MPSGKAAGNDGIANEMLKLCSQIISPYLVSIFNGIFDTGNFPEEWCKAINIPLYKSGDVNKVHNYRGISLLSVLSKVFTGILNNRLKIWVEENKLLEEQIGLRQGRSIRDHYIISFKLLLAIIYVKQKGDFIAFSLIFQKRLTESSILFCFKN